jgi:valyl-tRNA synthetase
VRKGRDLRREANIPASKKARYVFKPANPVTPYDQEVVRLLLNAEKLELNADYEPPKGTPSYRSEMGELFLPLEGMVDVTAEKARLTKEIQKAETEITKVKEKLNNPAFAQKVPVAVLQEHQRRLADWETKHAHLTASLQALG